MEEFFKALGVLASLAFAVWTVVSNVMANQHEGLNIDNRLKWLEERNKAQEAALSELAKELDEYIDTPDEPAK